MIEFINQYGTVISIIIAAISLLASVIIAVCTSRSSAKDTKKQINSMKDLCILQLRSTSEMLYIEWSKQLLQVEEGKTDLLQLDYEYRQLRNKKKTKQEEIDSFHKRAEALRRNNVFKNNVALNIFLHMSDIDRMIQIVNNRK